MGTVPPSTGSPSHWKLSMKTIESHTQSPSSWIENVRSNVSPPSMGQLVRSHPVEPEVGGAQPDPD